MTNSKNYDERLQFYL